MKIFGKGGKLNIIDVIVILIVVAALAFVAVRFVFNASAEADDAEESNPSPSITFTVNCEQTDATLARSIIASLEGGEMDYKGEAVTTTRIYNSYKLYDAYLTDWSYDEETRMLVLTIEASAEPNEGSYTLGTQEIRLGKEFIVKTLSVEITGYVSSMEIAQ